MQSVNHELSPQQSDYIKRLAYRYAKLRKSGSIDAQDLASAANIRWWQFCVRNPDILDERIVMICFYQQVKGAMRDVVRDSSPVKVTRTMQAQLKAYQTPSTVALDHAIDIYAGDTSVDTELWMDVVASLKKLPEREQMILELYFQHGFNYSEIAQILEVSVSTVTRSYAKAIHAIKEDLAGVEIPCK